MFHIANKVYLEYDFKFVQGPYSYLIASERLNTHPMVITPTQIQHQVDSFESLLADAYDGDYNKFWTMLLTKHHKFVAFVTPDIMLDLMVQYWKSIFADMSLEAMHFLYTSQVESVHLQSYMDNVWSFMHENAGRESARNQLPFLTVEEFEPYYDRNEAQPILLTLDPNLVGIEYLLADFFADQDTPHKAELLSRIEFLTWDNWLDELEHLKYEILSGAIDAHRIDPTISPTVGSIEEELAKSDILKWTVDPNFNEDIEYIRATYDYTIFNPCWQKLADAWGIPYDDMDELNEMINTDQYEALLMRDINRNYGSSYTRTRFMNKANQVFATYVYDCVRKDETDKLAPYALRR